MPKKIIFILCFCFSQLTFAAGPMWTLNPVTATTLTVPSNSSATVQYTVSNQTQKALILAMKPIQGITQITNFPGACTSPFSLSSHQSCALRLLLKGSALPPLVKGGPVVCQANINGTPNANSCYQPNSTNQLNIKKLTVEPNATLSASVSNLALSVRCPTSSPGCTYSNSALTGMPRIITVTNQSDTKTALNVSPTATPALPEGTRITPHNCTIQPHGTCVFTITPGKIPSAAPGDIDSRPINLTIAGDNTNTLTVALNILTYGSVYQSGYLFAVDDTTPEFESMSGSVVALTQSLLPIPWQANCDSFDPSSCTLTAANDEFNGVSNTAAIVSALSALPPDSYAAGLCHSATTGGYSNWYLPAICELRYGSSSCGTEQNPTIQNIQSNLVDNTIIHPLDSYWSSTQAFSSELTQAYFVIFDPPGFLGGELKLEYLYVYCARTLAQ